REIFMPSPRVVMAGTGFTAVRQFLIEALPGARLDQVEVETLRAKGHAADVMLPAMSRIDGALMDRIEGLRLIQQWGAGLEGVDIAAASERKIAVANVPTPGTGTAEIIGLGGIGQALAARLRPFGMRLIGLQRRPEVALADRLGMEWIAGPE